MLQHMHAHVYTPCVMHACVTAGRHLGQAAEVEAWVLGALLSVLGLGVRG